MTTQTLYNQLKSGDINNEKFLYEVRRDLNLSSLITKYNTLNDVINILKSKSIISESKDVMGKYKADKNPELPEQNWLTIDQVSPYEYAKGIDYELELTQISVGQNMPKEEDIISAQKKVLKNLTSNKYYYTQKMMGYEEKKQEKSNLRPTELKQDMIAPNQMKKVKGLKENLDQHYSQDDENGFDTCGCREKDQILKQLGLTPSDLEDEDIASEIELILAKQSLEEDYNSWDDEPYYDDLPRKKSYRWDTDDDVEDEFEDDEDDDYVEDEFEDPELDEAIALKDKMGNIQYAKDDAEASSITNSARTKGVILNKSRV